LSQERGKALFIECVEDPLTDSFPQSGTIVEERLGLDAELILIGLPEMPPIDRRKIRVRMKGGNDQGAVGMQHAVPLPEGHKGGRHICQ
jgi:hypothetical protein